MDRILGIVIIIGMMCFTVIYFIIRHYNQKAYETRLNYQKQDYSKLNQLKQSLESNNKNKEKTNLCAYCKKPTYGKACTECINLQADKLKEYDLK